MRQKDKNVRVRDTNKSGFGELQRGLTGERTLVGGSYMDNPSMLRAYLDYYWPISFEQTRHALAVSAFLARHCAGNNVDERKHAFSFRRIIDVGSGPGPVAAALVGAGAEEANLLDQSERALSLAREVVPSRCGRKLAKDELVLSTIVMDISDPDSRAIPLWGKADCISFGHSLNEVASGKDNRIEQRVALIERYAAALVSGGCILIIEPALLSTSRDLLAVRNCLVEKGWRVAAPCPNRAALSCPALGAGPSQTCHDEIFWSMPPTVAALARSLKLDKESLKMTWFLLLPPLSGAGQSVKKNGEKIEPLFRVVSDPMLNKGGRIRRLLCGGTGRFPLSASEGSPDAARCRFDTILRGDFIRVENPELRENGWGIAGDTRITILRRSAGKGDAR